MFISFFLIIHQDILPNVISRILLKGSFIIEFIKQVEEKETKCKALPSILSLFFARSLLFIF